MRDFKQLSIMQSSRSQLNTGKIRQLLSSPIKMEVDLETRQILVNEEVKKHLNLDFTNEKIDQLIRTYVDPKDTKKLINSLNLAGKGKEKPIRFNFMKPGSPKIYSFEYRYEIVYVKYACTRLSGTLVKIDR
jgi:hypothetical protein